MTDFSDEQLLRYSRQILLPDFDVAGQQALAESSVLIVGLGGLGCPVALYLAAAGVGELYLADFDEVDFSNLQRQIAHQQSDVGRNKAASVADSIAAINSDTSIQVLSDKLEAEALEQAVAAVNLVLDCSDNMATRFAVNRACIKHKKPLVSGAAIASEGQVSVFDPRQDGSPCYRCLYHEADDSSLNCSESGVLAPIVGLIGSIQALEAVKVLAGYGQPLTGRLLLIDGKSGDFRSLQLPRDPQCPDCGATFTP